MVAATTATFCRSGSNAEPVEADDGNPKSPQADAASRFIADLFTGPWNYTISIIGVITDMNA